MCFMMRILLVFFAFYFKDIFTQNVRFKFERVPKEPKMQSPNCNYCKISTQNTFCLHSHGGTASSCGKILKQGLDDNLKQEILDAHNDLRGKIARGEEPELRGITASNMMELRWDDELAHGAQLWANQCKWKHDSNDVCRFRVGQNLFQRGLFNHDSLEVKVTPDWRKACFEWYDEVREPGLRPGMNPTKWTGGTYLGVGHFTQLIWASTEYVGCGYMVYNHPSVRNHDTQYYVCNYGAAGNYNGRPVYQGGATCSACPEGTSCTDRGLCARGGSETTETPETTTEDDFVFTLPPFTVRPPATETPESEICDVQLIKDYLESCSIKENVFHYLRNITVYN